MIQKDLRWTSDDKLSIFAHTWSPVETPKAAVTLVHGFGEHCLRYTPYIEFLANAGIAVLGFDLRGHGQSEGKRGAINSYESLLDDIEMALTKTKELFPNIPQFVYGHSMGGNLVLNYLLRRTPDLKGAIVTSPWLKLTNEPIAILKGMVSLFKNIIPNVTIDSGLKTKHISTDKVEVEKYEKDPLNHGRISFRLFDEITQSGIWAIQQSNTLTIPTLLMHGTDDQITSPLASRKTMENNKQFIELLEWEGGYHELHNEPNRPDIAKAVITWITKNL